MNIAFFDFDGTITKKDSLFAFMEFLLGKKTFYLGLLKNVHWLCGYFLGWISNTRAKEKLIQFFLEGMSEQTLRQSCQDFLPSLQKIINPKALERIAWHKSQGDRIVVVSATFGCYLSPWCEEYDLEYLATELEIIEGRLSGRFETPNCYGAQKVKRIKEKYDVGAYQKIYAYGDSKGDEAMLRLADYPFYRSF